MLITYKRDYCYVCSSDSNLCRFSVFDGKYLTVQKCKTKCFMRTEQGKIFRGCFDGWVKGLVRQDYLGCQTQSYLGQTVEWCFCKGTVCNGASRNALAKASPPRVNRIPLVDEGSENDVEESDVENQYSQHDMTFEASDRLTEGGYNDQSTVDRKSLTCFACNSVSKHCQFQVTDARYLTVTPCNSKCFVRRDEEVTYRGCFDGWMGGVVEFNYVGCRRQSYHGKVVEWCFCEESRCNGVSLYHMGMANNIGQPAIANIDDSSVDADHSDNQLPEDDYQPAYGAGGCRALPDGLYRDPNTCYGFIHCFSGFTYRNKCPKGLAWNERQKNCDYVFNTACGYAAAVQHFTKTPRVTNSKETPSSNKQANTGYQYRFFKK
ncbi:unnamed protein product [Owenia fusiformis]|uniref:Uncharacterized protein n=1 Tax=Owenia fusiformis TaxID=6347 RepID=A0A8J1UI20_OWEFU|nr:unnamed protein product [Owenia fusiformis]